MCSEVSDFTKKRIEQAISKMGSDIATAMALVQQTKALSSNMEALLIHAQQEVEDLYVSLWDQESSISDC